MTLNFSYPPQSKPVSSFRFSPGPVPVSSTVPSGLIRRNMIPELKSPDLVDVDLDKMYLDVVTEDYKTAITR